MQCEELIKNLSVSESKNSFLTEQNEKYRKDVILTETELVSRVDALKIKESIIDGLEKELANSKEVFSH